MSSPGYNQGVIIQGSTTKKTLIPVAVLLLLTGCGSTPEAAIQPTPAWTPAPVEQQRPTQSVLLPEGELVQNQEDCVNDAEFVEDLTIPDLTQVEPGEELDKRWMVQNSGSCDWDSGYRLVNVGGDGFEGPEDIALFPARAGSSAVLQVMLRAPQDPGEHISRWQARSPDGQPFGDEVFVYILVPTPTPAPSPTSQ
jgi:hypothetical protein